MPMASRTRGMDSGHLSLPNSSLQPLAEELALLKRREEELDQQRALIVRKKVAEYLKSCEDCLRTSAQRSLERFIQQTKNTNETKLLGLLQEKEMLIKSFDAFRLDLEQKMKVLEGFIQEIEEKTVEVEQGYEESVSQVQKEFQETIQKEKQRLKLDIKKKMHDMAEEQGLLTYLEV
ncbi:cointegrate resolution protein T [Planoprotostelium fungivorum]|uniref:Cointegrate resolution protein T n=1 Tax=Planoprotostelium fungivorum TaxID=1890364 RepID=A0A2P6MQS7_9EUKA|nr:cointegrate resolution protein T [Planoprotostelium fungivorum]